MKTQSDDRPVAIQPIGRGNYYVNMNIREVEHNTGGMNGGEGAETHISYEADTVKVAGYPTYGGVVEKLIREEYTESDELAIQRQRDTKPEDFAEYNDYCEWCKSSARPVFFPLEGGE